MLSRSIIISRFLLINILMLVFLFDNIYKYRLSFIIFSPLFKLRGSLALPLAVEFIISPSPTLWSILDVTAVFFGWLGVSLATLMVIWGGRESGC